MDFEFTDEQKLIQQTARKVMEREIIPVADEYDKTKALLDRKKLKGLLDKIAPLGYLGHVIPEEWGGAGLDYLTLCVLMEELFRAYASLGGVILIQTAARSIHQLGSEDQKRRFLPGLVSGEMIACTAITEPNVGSNNAGIETLAREDGDSYVINGTKTWISNGSISDLAIVVAQTERGAGAKGICHLIVDRGESPYSARELPKLGLRSFPTSEVVFEDCRVPKENLLVPPGEGLKRILKLYEGARAIMAIGAVGMAQAAIDASVRYAKERTQFGRPIGQFQLIQAMIAEMIAETDAARLLAQRVFWMLDKKARCDREASIAKFYATEAAVRVTSKAIQIHGAYGLSEEYPVERFFRDARSFTIPDGTTEIQKLVVGRSVLGMQAFR
jgi:alkylation response protein AidB-like acyl-CoA dehydrogenase